MSEQPSRPLFSGQDFTKSVHSALKKNADKVDVKALSAFCGSNVETVRKWTLNYNQPAGGKVTLKLAYFLRELGIEIDVIDEVSRRRPVGSLIGELLTFDVIDMPEARKLAGGVVAETVLAVARGQALEKYDNTAEALAQFRQECPDYEMLLLFARNDLRVKLGLSPLPDPDGTQDDVTPLSAGFVPEPDPPMVEETQEAAEPESGAVEPVSLVPEPIPEPNPVVAPPVVVYDSKVLEAVLQENRTALTSAFEIALEKFAAQFQAPAPAGHISLEQTVTQREPESLQDTVELLRFLSEAADKIRAASVVVKLLLEHSSPEARSIFRSLLDDGELRLLRHRLSKITGEHAKSFLESSDGE